MNSWIVSFLPFAVAQGMAAYNMLETAVLMLARSKYEPGEGHLLYAISQLPGRCRLDSVGKLVAVSATHFGSLATRVLMPLVTESIQ
jgi:hypothetical protein